MNRPEIINNELYYFSQHPRCFTAQELLNFAAEEIDLMDQDFCIFLASLLVMNILFPSRF